MEHKTTALVVSHTHWDREWYLPFQRFRMKLVDLIDGLLDILDSEPSYRYFTLDGQTVVLEDYLEIRPENKERLAKYVREGRLLIGPWYVLPDEFLVSGESLVRNLLLGHLMAAPYGGAMPVGYLPDTFGHPAQMPQILRGFGLDNAVVYRGVQTDTSEFIWQAPDGSEVLTIYLPGGYCNAMQLTAAPWRFLVRLPEILSNVQSVATTNTVLLMNGCDHLPPRREIEQIIDEANRQLNNGVELRQGTLPQYIASVKAANPKLSKQRGEFRLPRPARVTPGVISARMYLKLANFRSFTMLEKYAEPVASLAWLLGEPYPKSFLWQAWEYLLQNHPHDSICGCSIDAVHDDMMARFRWTQEIGEELMRRGLELLAPRIDVSAFGEDAAFLAFNPLLQSREGNVQQYINFLEPGQEFHIVNARGEVIPHQVIGRRPVTMFYDPFLCSIELDGKQKRSMMAVPKPIMDELHEARMWRQWQGEEVEILLLPDEIPAGGYTTYAVRLGAAVAAEQGLRSGPNWMENDLVRVAINCDGTLELLDKRNGTTYAGLNLFEDSGDCGDEYTYCPPRRDSVAARNEFKPRTRLVEDGPVRATFELKSRVALPKGLTKDRRRRTRNRIGCPITAQVSLTANSPRVEVRVEVMNLAEDNVLRVLFPTPIQTEWSHALGQFEVVKRPVRVPECECSRTPGPDEEVAVNTYPHHAFVDVNDGERGLAILSRGLTEYEAIPDEDGVMLALTLLRSVGWLSRPDLPTRHGHAGPGLETPGAQCLGEHVFEYALLPHCGDWSEAGVPQEADRYIITPAFASVPAKDGNLPQNHSFVSLQPGELVMSALKKAESEDALILRFYNTSADTVQARMSVDARVRTVCRVNLAEEEIGGETLTVDESGHVELEVRGYEICSLKLIPKLITK